MASASITPESAITLGWKDDILSLHHPDIAGGKIDTWYLEAYCRPGSSDREWGETTIGHSTDDKYAYLKKSFISQDADDEPDFMPTARWATEACYTPGQVWCPKGVPRDDVNPRPLHPDAPANGLIGCISGDGRWILATAWQPYQELFQGVIRCLHSDFRIGGLAPGEKKRIRGRIYLVPNDIPSLPKRYRADFAEG